MNEIIDSKDPEGLRLAFEALREQLDEQTEVRRANTDLPKAINFAASVGRMVLQPERRAAFAQLPPAFFDILWVDRLEQTAHAANYALLQAQDARSTETGAKLPPPNTVEATVLRSVMIRVLEYHVGAVPRVIKRLASIRGGKGHADLASDLWRLGVLYEEFAAELAGDTRLYRVEDAARAKQYAQAINHVLGDATESDALVWNDTLARAWTLLVNTYDEVAAAGRWLFRHENGEAMFPSLYAIGRQSRRRRQPEGGDELPGEELPGDDEEIEPAQPA